MDGILVDTNVFVAAGFNAKSASARILAAIRENRLQLVWNEPTRRETEFVLRRIPPLGWNKFADLFRPEREFTRRVDPHDFAFIEDPDDRNSRPSVQQPKSHLLPMTTISWCIEIWLALTF